ncbi:MAG: ABC transporter permease subunit, partial [Myxococcota bacterium]
MMRDHFRLRVDRVLAVAWRDWRQELKGPQGLWLPIVMAALLVPSSAAPLPRAMAASEATLMTVSGDVPDEVLALEQIRLARRRAQLRFHQRGEVLYTAGDDPPIEVRRILDRDDGTEIRLERFTSGFVFPGRSLLFALISASTLTGAISASIGGERSNGTLVTMMAAAISRFEIVLGKLTAWGGLGAFTALGAALLAIGLDRIDGGFWLLPLPFVPVATAAFGLWLVRKATDVVAASTTLIRVLPVLLVTTGIVAWLFGNSHPLLGALVPIGGALVAAGDTWEGILAPLVATASAIGFTAFCVVGTARELESPSNGAPVVQQV